MDGRKLQIMTALTILFIGLLYLFQNISALLNLDINIRQAFYAPLSWIVAILALITAALLIGDALKMKDDED